MGCWSIKNNVAIRNVLINIFSMVIRFFQSLWWCISCMFWIAVFESGSKAWFFFSCLWCLVMMGSWFYMRFSINVFWVLFWISKTWHSSFFSCLWLSNWIFHLIGVFELIACRTGFLCLWRRIIIFSKCILTEVINLSPVDDFLCSWRDLIWLFFLCFWFF